MKHKYKNIIIIVLALLLIYFIYQSRVQNTNQKIYTNIGTLQTTTKYNPNTPGPKYNELYEVTRVIDGDTIDIAISGKNERVRLLGINTPESVAQNRPDECYGSEASLYLKSLIERRKVTIELDPKKPERDEYGRVLAYIIRDDGLHINKAMIQEGYAYEYTYKSEKYKYQNEFKQSQVAAKQSQRGLWASDTCAGKK